MPGNQPEEYYQNLWDTILSGETCNGKIINKRKYGELYIANQTIAPITNENGEIENFVAVQDDITELKMQRQKLDVLHRVLRHNLRNDISILNTYIDMILEKSEDEEIIDLVKKIKNATAGLENISDKTNDMKEILQIVTNSSNKDVYVDLQEKLKRYKNELLKSHPNLSISLDIPEGKINSFFYYCI